MIFYPDKINLEMASKKMSNINCQPKVFAVIPIRNRKDKTLRFLEQFIKQKYNNLNIVLVDANSTDGTQDVIITSYPQIKLIHVDNECYWTASTNRGIEYALDNDADFILTINDDSYVNVNYIFDLVNLALKHNLEILGSRIDYMDNPGLIWSLGAYCNWGTRNILQLSYSQIWTDDLPLEIKEQEIISAQALAGNGVLINKSVFKKIGFYNDKFLPHYHADSEFVMRAVKNKINAYVSTKIVVYNDFSIDTEALKYTSNFFSKRSHVFFLPILYIVGSYCPFEKKIKTLLSFFLIPLVLSLKEKTQIRSRFIRWSKKVIKKIFSHVMSVYNQVLN